MEWGLNYSETKIIFIHLHFTYLLLSYMLCSSEWSEFRNKKSTFNFHDFSSDLYFLPFTCILYSFKISVYGCCVVYLSSYPSLCKDVFCYVVLFYVTLMTIGDRVFFLSLPNYNIHGRFLGFILPPYPYIHL